MTRLIARLILAMLILPLTGVIIVMWMAVLATISPGGPPSPVAMALMWLVVDAFVAAYWILLWRGIVQWTPKRRSQTVLFGVIAIVCCILLGALIRYGLHAPGFGAITIGGGIGPIIWVLATVLIWRETPAERVERLSRLGADSICCPICGYNMTGLRESRCPECGGQFTLDQLLAAQPHKDAATIPDE